MNAPFAGNNVTGRCTLFCKKLQRLVDLAALTEIFSRLDSPSILGGNHAKKDADRFSYWAANPLEIFEFTAGQTDPFEKLQSLLEKYTLISTQPNELPKGVFRGGWIGCFSYGLAGYIEHLPATAIADLRIPLVRLCFYDRLICYDHIECCFWLIALQLPDDTEQPQRKLHHLELLLDAAQKIILPTPPPADLDNIDLASLQCNMDKARYFSMLRKIKKYIYDGDVYQINFSQRFHCDFAARPVDLFHWQNHYNPSGYAAYIDAGLFQLVSASPEMFITVTDRTIATKPIKGTRRRLPDTPRSNPLNRHNIDDLLTSEKEQAELNMIIDLERNDVARICWPGSRHVVQPRTIEAYPTVFHAVATIQGRLRDEITFSDIIKAMFPGGSITGAPKIRSMEIIDETEPTARSVYTGSIGYISLDGTVCLNIAIRTIIIMGHKAFAQTGGGIVADSDPNEEWDETITKARALLAGITAVQKNARTIRTVTAVKTAAHNDSTAQAPGKLLMG